MGRSGVIGGEHGDGERHRRLESGLFGAVVQPLDAGLEHVDPTGGVQGEVLHAESAEHAGGDGNQGAAECFGLFIAALGGEDGDEV